MASAMYASSPALAKQSSGGQRTADITDHRNSSDMKKRKLSSNNYVNSDVIRGQNHASPPAAIDLRSDTVTRPNDEMRRAMAEAEVGDDVFMEDPTCIEFQRQAAELLGKEDALYVPSGTMGNLISVMVHCRVRGHEILLGEKSHIYMFEQGGIAQIGGVHPNPLKNNENGTFDMDEVRGKVRPTDDVHQPRTKLICVENPFNGRVLPLSYMKEIFEFSRSMNLILHLDGARLFNACAALNKTPRDFTQFADTVSLCLSKGMGAPVGSVIAGSKEFIHEARRTRRVLGGGMRQAGILTAAGIVALKGGLRNAQEDHKHAMTMAKAISDLGSGKLQVDLRQVETNMVMVNLPTNDLTPESFTELMATRDDDHDDSVLFFPYGVKRVRMVMHWNVTDDQVQAAVRKLRRVMGRIERG